MYHGKKLMVLIALILSPLAFAQESVCVFDFEGVSVDQPTAIAATQIFRSELQATGKFMVMSKGDMEAKLSGQGIKDYTCHDINCASNYGYTAGTEYSIIGSLVKLGERVTAEVRLISVIKKEMIFSDRFSSTSIDDLEATLRKLARAVADRKKIESEVGRFAITEEETTEPRRKQSYITSGASFGFGFPMGESYAEVDNIKTLAWMLRYEAGPYVIENSIGISWGSAKPDSTEWGYQYDKVSISIIPWDIGMRYIFSRESDFAPFIGGGLGFHFIAAQDFEGQTYIDNDQALAVHIAGGIYGFQSYDFRLTLEGKYTMLFSDTFGANAPSTSHQIGISVGISRKFEKGEKRGCMSGGCMF